MIKQITLLMMIAWQEPIFLSQNVMPLTLVFWSKIFIHGFIHLFWLGCILYLFSFYLYLIDFYTLFYEKIAIYIFPFGNNMLLRVFGTLFWKNSVKIHMYTSEIWLFKNHINIIYRKINALLHLIWMSLCFDSWYNTLQKFLNEWLKSPL